MTNFTIFEMVAGFYSVWILINLNAEGRFGEKSV